MNHIYTLSPYYVTTTNALQTSCTLELYVYLGTANGAWTGSLTYTLESTAIDTISTFEISDLIKDSIPALFRGEYIDDSMSTGDADEICTTIWVDYRTTQVLSAGADIVTDTLGVLAHYGYGFFEEGSNPNFENACMLSNNVILKPDDSVLRIPVNVDYASSVTFNYGATSLYTYSIPAQTEASKQVLYVTNAVGDYNDFEERVIEAGGIFEGSICLSAFLNDTTTYPVTSVFVEDVNGNVEDLSVQNETECKYEPIKITFLNKFGALQDVWFFKNNIKTLATRKVNYKGNILSSTGTYNIGDHQDMILTNNGAEAIKLNSGWYPESNNIVFKELMLSTKVWIEYNNETLAVIVKDSAFVYKNTLTDKLFQHQMSFDFAYNTINNVQ
mgnify:FL=1|tara:strand:+ start:4434 stop:5594 length:1161 start_codon:yes stop_codon:yes gene_type:complete